MFRPDATSRSGFTRYDAGLLVVSLIWGANFSAIKYALASIPPLAFSAARFLIACSLFVVAVRLLEGSRPIPRRTFWVLVVLGLIGNTGYQAAFMGGLARTTATNSSLIMGAMPVMVAGLATVLRIERPGGRLWAGMTMAVLGVVLVIASRGLEFRREGLDGDLLVLLACACWAVFTVGLRKIGTAVSPLRVTAITTYAGTPGLLLLAWGEAGTVAWRSLDAWTWFGLLYSGVLAIAVAYVLWSVAVQRIGGSRTAVYNCVIPLFAGLVAWATLGERPGLSQLAGAGLVVSGVLLSQTGRAVAAGARPGAAVPEIPD